MRVANSTHDDLIRQTLVEFRGYEITTVGDAFQLAFFTVDEAIRFSVAIQKRLLQQRWPKVLDSIHCCKYERDRFGRAIFKGLRVRIGIHMGGKDVIMRPHPVTGRATYSGASEVVAQEVGDAGMGGQIIISEAAALAYINAQATSSSESNMTTGDSTGPIERSQETPIPSADSGSSPPSSHGSQGSMSKTSSDNSLGDPKNSWQKRYFSSEKMGPSSRKLRMGSATPMDSDPSDGFSIEPLGPRFLHSVNMLLVLYEVVPERLGIRKESWKQKSNENSVPTRTVHPSMRSKKQSSDYGSAHELLETPDSMTLV